MIKVLSVKFLCLMLILISLTHPSLLFGQDQKYCAEDFLWSSCYTLLPQNRFEYEEFTCTAKIVGQGFYEKAKDSILFHFEPMESVSNQMEIRKVKSHASDVVLYIEAFDAENEEAIDAINVDINPKQGVYDFNVLKGSSLEIISDEFPLKIEMWIQYSRSSNVIIEAPGVYHVSLSFNHADVLDAYEYMQESEAFLMIARHGEMVELKRNGVFGTFVLKGN